MFEAFLCGYNFFCHAHNFLDKIQKPKYPPNVAQLCYYFEEQKSELPEYCRWKSEVKPPRRRSEF